MRAQSALWTNPADGKVWVFVVGNSGTHGFMVDVDAAGNPSLNNHWNIDNGWTTSAVVANGGVFTAVGGGGPDFSISVAPSTQTVNAGSPAVYTVTVAPLRGFTGTVSLAASGLPTGATASFNPSSIANGSGTSTLAISTSASEAGGTSAVSVNGTSGTLANSATVDLVVVPAGGVCTTVTAGGGFKNTPFAAQSGTFTVTYDATPSNAPTNSIVALSRGAQTSNTGFAVVVAFSKTGDILALNGGTYTSHSPIAYSAGVTYQFRVVVNVTAHTYSVFVTPPGGTELTVATEFAFRTALNTVTSLDNAGESDSLASGSLTVCNFTP